MVTTTTTRGAIFVARWLFLPQILGGHWQSCRSQPGWDVPSTPTIGVFTASTILRLDSGAQSKLPHWFSVMLDSNYELAERSTGRELAHLGRDELNLYHIFNPCHHHCTAICISWKAANIGWCPM
ncbi:hypothetical protein C8Q79DRAFT_443510 [Trametes meyenii]|nr:hypothetical protein C8Q79DRAFT_443510 [Trametes meyenii]